VDGGHAGVLDARKQLPFALEALGECGAAAMSEHLERDLATRVSLARAVDGAHVAAADRSEHLEVAEVRSGGQLGTGARRTNEYRIPCELGCQLGPDGEPLFRRAQLRLDLEQARQPPAESLYLGPVSKTCGHTPGALGRREVDELLEEL